MRPGVYHRHFQEHESKELALTFGNTDDVLTFKASLKRLQLRAIRLGAASSTPDVSRRSSGFIPPPPQNPPPIPSLVVNPPVGDDATSLPRIVQEDEEDEGAPTLQTSYRDNVSTQGTLDRRGPGRSQVQILSAPGVYGRPGWHGSTVSRDDSFRNRISRWARGSVN